jgi:hypothetical protein
MYGVVNGLYYCNLDRNLELDNRIYERNIPSSSLQPSFGIRPVSTKYDLLPIVDRYKPATVSCTRNASTPIYNINTTFNPGNATAPYEGYASNVNTESTLRNQFFALTDCPQADYIPSSNSDLYQWTFQSKTRNEPNPHTLLFEQQQFNQKPEHNTFDLGRVLFNNATRQQLKDVKCDP